VRTVECVGLIVVLLNGGMDTGWRRFRAAAGPIMAIGIAGTFITAAVLTGTAHWLLGMDWNLAGVVGAAWRRPTPPSCSPFWVSRSAAVVIDRRPRQRSSPA
jgi:potassium/hydrogen antiporter